MTWAWKVPLSPDGDTNINTKVGRGVWLQWLPGRAPSFDEKIGKLRLQLFHDCFIQKERAFTFVESCNTLVFRISESINVRIEELFGWHQGWELGETFGS